MPRPKRSAAKPITPGTGVIVDLLDPIIPIDPRLIGVAAEAIAHSNSMSTSPQLSPDHTVEDSIVATTQDPDSTLNQVADTQAEVTWTDEMRYAFFCEMLDQVKDGQAADSGFKKAAWIAALEEVNIVYKGPGLVSLVSARSMEQRWKARYKDFKFLREQSGFGWDEDAGMITASDQAWDDIIAVSCT
jgi:Myb/SANT-like DNA-binding domain